MVDGLAERLKRDGRDLAGWQRLINAYAVLGRGQDARTALAEARKNFPADETAQAALAALAKSLGSTHELLQSARIPLPLAGRGGVGESAGHPS